MHTRWIWVRGLILGCLAVTGRAEQFGNFGSTVAGTVERASLQPAREEASSTGSPAGSLMHYAHYEVVLTWQIAHPPEGTPPTRTQQVYLAPDTPEEYLRPGQRLRVIDYKQARDASTLRISYNGLQLITDDDVAQPAEKNDAELADDDNLVIRISEDDLRANPDADAARSRKPQSFLVYQDFGRSADTRENGRIDELAFESRILASKKADARAAGTRTAARLLLPVTLLLIVAAAAVAAYGRHCRRKS